MDVPAHSMPLGITGQAPLSRRDRWLVATVARLTQGAYLVWPRVPIKFLLDPFVDDPANPIVAMDTFNALADLSLDAALLDSSAEHLVGGVVVTPERGFPTSVEQGLERLDEAFALAGLKLVRIRDPRALTEGHLTGLLYARGLLPGLADPGAPERERRAPRRRPGGARGPLRLFGLGQH